MVEVPSAALLAHRMLEVVDFLSIGTNDLTQYTMAADRMATDLAHLTDAWQPAVLQLIAITAEAGKQAGKPVGRLRRGRRRPAARVRAGRHGHHVAVDGLGRGPPGRGAARRGEHGHPRGRRRGRARRERPDGRPRRRTTGARRLTGRHSWPLLHHVHAVKPSPAGSGRAGHTAAATLTGTPFSAALPETSSSSGSVRSLIETPGTFAAFAIRVPSTWCP